MSAPEKVEEHEADKLMEMLGFTTIRFSQPRASMQTPGIPDRRYYRGARGRSAASTSFSVWYEAKAPNGRQSASQRRFQALVEACGETYVLGTFDEMLKWCRANGLVR